MPDRDSRFSQGVAVAPSFLDSLAGGGEMGERIRAFDWSKTPLGPLESWPQALRTSVSTSLGCAFPIVLWWGPELTILYNDEYRSALGPEKHPSALGRAGAVVWAEIWDTIGPMLAGVVESGVATRSRDLRLHIVRAGYPEEAYFSFSYSPIYADDGHVGGVFCPVIETTEKVIGERRLRTLRDLAARCHGAENEDAVFESAAAVLAENPHDVPFALLYRIDESGSVAKLAAAAGIEAGSGAAPRSVELRDPGEGEGEGTWALGAVSRSGKPIALRDLGARFERLPAGAWERPPAAAEVRPILLPGQGRPRAILVAAVSPMRALDADYRTFYELVSTQIAAGLADALALEAERRRAESLAEIDRAKTAFFSNVSHEFRTPLTLMLGPVEDLLSLAPGPWQLDATARARLEIVHRNSLRLLRLVNTMLDFSRIEAGRARASYRSTDLAALTADLASSFRSACERAGLALRVDCAPLREPVLVDRDMWEKIVLNLLSNAFKFTLEGEIEVTLREVDGRAALSVRDSGVGIPADEIPRMFERFHRVRQTRGRTHEGTGIGLALVRELARLHGGDVRVESALGEGSRFTVEIPFGAAHLDAAQIGTETGRESTATGAAAFVEEALRWLPEKAGDVALREPVAAPKAERPPGAARPRVVWADDNADMRAYVTRLLSERFEVEAFADGDAALEAAFANPPDLVLADVMMPKRDGFELLSALRANPATAEVPVILLSARAGEESRVEGVAAGADDYLVKPFAAAELLARVETHQRLARLRRESAAALRRRDDFLTGLLGSVTDSFFAVDSQWRVEFVNDEFVRRARRSREELLHRNMWELFPEAVGNVAHVQLQRAMAERVSVEYELYYEPWRRWFMGRAFPTPDGGLAVFSRDVTEMKRAEEALVRQHAQFETLVKQAPLGVYLLDSRFRIVLVNPVALPVFGSVPGGVLGRDFDEVVRVLWPKPYADEVVARFRHTLETGEPFEAPERIEERLDRGVAESYEWRIDRIPLSQSAGGPFGVVCYFRDVSAQVKARREREALLESERAARVEADRATRARDEFLAILSHELRSPLNAIAGWTQLLKMEPGDSAKVLHSANIIERNTRAQTQLIADLLDMSRIASGKMRLDIAPVDPRAAVETAVQSIRPVAEAKSLRVESVLRPIDGVLLGDAARLEQILANLLANAVKFTPAGGLVSVELGQGESSSLRLVVRDTGEGVEPEFLPHLFDRFRQADETIARRYGGLGLGLALVKQLTEMHGGRVEAESAGKGRGATFVVTLPLVAEDAVSSGRSSAGAPALPIEPFEFGGTTVLVVDDDRDSVEMVKRLLEERGADVIVAFGADEALARLERQRVDVILSDIGMPVRDGFEFMVEARKRGIATPAVALTAFARSEDREKVLRSGYQAHLGKPIDASRMLATVAALVSGARRAPAR